MRSARARAATIAADRLVTTLRAAILAAALVGVAAAPAENAPIGVAPLGVPSPTTTATLHRPAPTPTSLTALDGPADAPAGEHIPDLDFPTPSPADMSRMAGLPTSARDLIVIFQATTTVAEANAVLRSLPAVIVGGTPDAKALLIRLTGPPDLERVLAAQAALLANPLVAAASVNAASAPDGGDVR